MTKVKFRERFSLKADGKEFIELKGKGKIVQISYLTPIKNTCLYVECDGKEEMVANGYCMQMMDGFNSALQISDFEWEEQNNKVICRFIYEFEKGAKIYLHNDSGYDTSIRGFHVYYEQ